MTVIAYDGKILAGDKQSSWQYTKNTTTKLKILNDGAKDIAIAVCGSLAESYPIRHWFENGSKIEDFPKTDKDDPGYLIMATLGQLAYFLCTPHPITPEDKYYAFGSGADAAMGAMYQGANAITAVKAAIHIDSSCGRGIDYIDLETMEMNTIPG